MRQILYIANMRLPSERAHSVHVMEMCAALAGSDVNVQLLIPTRRTDIVAADLFSYYGVPQTFTVTRCRSFDAFRLPIPRALAYYLHAVTFAWSAYRTSRRFPAAQIISRDLFAAAILAFLGRTVIFEVHDLPSRRLRPLLRRLQRIITTNEWKRDRLVQEFGIVEKNILIAPNAVDTRKFLPSGKEVTPELAAKGWPMGRKVALYTGSLLSWKGVSTLVAAAKFLPAEFSVVIAGGSVRDGERLRERIATEGVSERVIFFPHQPHAEIPNLFAAADVLVLPTSSKEQIGREETSPIKAFEYLAAVKPIVASDVPSSREVLDESVAHFFTPDDPESLARAIEKAVAEWRREEGQKEKFYKKIRTWDERARGVLGFFPSPHRSMSEHPLCAICRVDDAEILFTKGDLIADITNVVCRRCGLVYMNPRPTVAEYREFHVEDFLRERHGLTTAEQVMPKIKGSDVRIKSAVADFIVPALPRGARVLDVGCGFGTLLHLLKERLGARVEGIELATVDVAAAKQFYGLELFNGSLEEFAIRQLADRQGEQFDCIALHHTFEHLPDPRGALRLMKGLLAPGGVLYIGVPNVMNMRKRPEIFFQMGHPYSYSPATLRQVLAAEGFSVVKFNRRAAFPGAMELLAVAGADSRALPALSEGADYGSVLRYVRYSQKKFTFFRAMRGISLFWLPRGLRLRVSHAVLQILKKM
ncbi:MAG: glycosyltransferase [Patescibacteria group bacterium]